MGDESWTLDAVDRWHAGSGYGLTLAAWLGMDPTEYAAWAEGRCSALSRDCPAERERIRLRNEALDELVSQAQEWGMYD
jgi:hypothetical protein